MIKKKYFYIVFFICYIIFQNFKKNILNFLSISFKKLNELNYKKTKKGKLFVVSHYFSFVDVFIMMKIMKDKKCKIVITRSWGEYATYPYNFKRKDIIVPNKSTEKIINYINNGTDVIIFYSDKWTNKGIYYIYKETECDLIFVRIINKILIKRNIYYPIIKDPLNLFLSFINNNYTVEFENKDMIKYKNEEPKEFIRNLKKILFRRDF